MHVKVRNWMFEGVEELIIKRSDLSESKEDNEMFEIQVDYSAEKGTNKMFQKKDLIYSLQAIVRNGVFEGERE